MSMWLGSGTSLMTGLKLNIYLLATIRVAICKLSYVHF